MSNEIIWRTDRKKVSALKPWDRNPRRITEKQMETLKKSLDRFGYAAPLVMNQDGQIIAGHMRLKAMLLLGKITNDSLIDVRVPSRPLTEKEARDLAILDNSTGGGWDWEMLANDFPHEELLDLGFEEIQLGLLAPAPEGEMDANGDVEPPKAKAVYEVAFGSGEELDQFEGLLNRLNRQYPDLPTIGTRLVAHLGKTLDK